MIDSATERRLEDSVARAIKWVQANRYKAYEPADGNASALFPLTGGRVWPMRIIQQVVLRSPINIRPLIALRPHESAIGRGYMAWGYLSLYRRDRSLAMRDEAVSCFDWLIAHRSPGFSDFCWGDPYHYATRSGRRPLNAPILIWTALIGQAFLDAYETLGDGKYLSAAKSAGEWVSKLPKEETRIGVCLSYNAYKVESIHNSNAMGAAFLARLGSITGNGAVIDLARRAMTYTVARQLANGAWFYGEEPKYHWIDNFHTGYNLSALHTYQLALLDTSFEPQLVQGLKFFKAHFFEPDGCPRYFHDQLYPVDIQCAAQAIETLVALSDGDPESLALALKVADWTIQHLQAPDGHFNYRRLSWTTVKTPMLHWGQGTMVKALAMALNALSARTSEPEMAVASR